MKKFEAADTQDNFLAKPIAVIASIENVREAAVKFRIFRAICIQQIDWDCRSVVAGSQKKTSANYHTPTFDRHRGGFRDPLKSFLKIPVVRLFDLLPVYEMLPKVSFAMK